MDTYQNGLVAGYIALDDGDVLETVVLLAERNETEVSICSGHINFDTRLDEFLVGESVGDEVANRYELKPPLTAALAELG